jgi:endogenous inhibitor of DNA gyrase (YacG/DUF329 family)
MFMSSLKCPVCQRDFDSDKSDALPFCSERCRQIDLGRWLDEKYGLPYESPEQPDKINTDEN